MDTCYLECIVGFDEHGQPEPLREIGLPISVQRLAGNDVVEDTTSIVLRPSRDETLTVPGRILPHTRIVATAEPRVVDALLGSGQYRLTDPPGARASDITADHRATRRRRAHRIEE